MSGVFSFTYLSDGSQVFLSSPTSGHTADGYQYFDVYEDAYLEDKVGMLGVRATSSVSAMWELGEVDADQKLESVMKLAFPMIDLPVSAQQIAVDPSGNFPVLQFFSGGDISYDETSRVIHIASATSPQEFFKSVLFKAKMSDDDVKGVVLTHAYVEGLGDPTGDFMFQTIEITNDIWPINGARVTKAYRSLIDDGTLQPMGGNTSSGFPSFTRLASQGRHIIEAANRISAPTPIVVHSKTLDDHPQVEAPSSYVAPELIERLVVAAKARDYNTGKLETVLDELNDAYARNKAQSAHALIRTLLNHIAPLFGNSTFAQAANNHKWTRTDKQRVHEIETLFRFDADESLHSPISKRNTAVDIQSVGVIRRTVNMILEEAIDQV